MIRSSMLRVPNIRAAYIYALQVGMSSDNGTPVFSQMLVSIFIIERPSIDHIATPHLQCFILLRSSSTDASSDSAQINFSLDGRDAVFFLYYLE